jgi:hypothetical protein
VPVIYRTAVVLHDAEGMTVATIADVQGIRLPAAKQRLRRGRMTLVSALALRGWTVRQQVAAAGFSVAFALLIGIPTVLIPNPIFGREILVLPWNYPVWIASSILAGMLAATYVRAERGAGSEKKSADTTDAPSRVGMVGGALAWFAVGCPVCNKIALLALGYTGAITGFAPVQPFLAAAALLTTAGALLMRLRGQTMCPTAPSVPAST